MTQEERNAQIDRIIEKLRLLGLIAEPAEAPAEDNGEQ